MSGAGSAARTPFPAAAGGEKYMKEMFSMQHYDETPSAVILAQQGDMAAKQLLLDIYKPLLLGQIRKYRMCFPSYEDAYQTAALAALECIAAFDTYGSKPFGYCLKASVHNRFRDYVTKKRRDDSRFIRSVHFFDETDGRDLPEPVDSDPYVQPETMLLLKDNRDQLKTTLQKLSAEEKCLVACRFRREWTERQIASAFGWSQAKVSRRLHALVCRLLYMINQA